MAETETIETYVVKNDDAPALRFRGTLLGKAYNTPDRARSDYSGVTGRSYEYKLYRTVGGSFVCERIGHTQWQGERDRYEAANVKNEAGVIAWFGSGQLAKELYDNAGIEFVKDID